MIKNLKLPLTYIKPISQISILTIEFVGHLSMKSAMNTLNFVQGVFTPDTDYVNLFSAFVQLYSAMFWCDCLNFIEKKSILKTCAVAQNL